MKVALRRKYTEPDQIKIEEIEKPIPKENEVLIQVHATSVNRTDCANLRAKPFLMRFFLGLFKPRKIILGTDFAGQVVAVGKDVKSHKIGDQVFSFNDKGSESQAEFTLKIAGDLFPMPKNIDYQQAAAGLEGAHYAYAFLHKVKIEAGQNILINGATGGIGSALLQFVRQFEVKITATCNTKNIELIQSLGADSIIDYTREDFTQDSEKYDFVFDTVGKSTFGKCKPILKQKGIYVSSELGPFAQNLFFPLLTTFSNQKVCFPAPFSTQESIPFISELLETGKFKPVIDREYSIGEISKAYDYVLKGQKTGNVLITSF